jgi:hypothetical protein
VKTAENDDNSGTAINNPELIERDGRPKCWCLERGAIDRLNDIVDSERALRLQLIKIREESPDKLVPAVIDVDDSGWSPAWVIVIGAAAVGAAAIGGYLIGAN